MSETETPKPKDNLVLRLGMKRIGILLSDDPGWSDNARAQEMSEGIGPEEIWSVVQALLNPKLDKPLRIDEGRADDERVSRSYFRTNRRGVYVLETIDKVLNQVSARELIRFGEERTKQWELGLHPKAQINSKLSF